MVFMKILERFKTKFALTQAKSWFTPIRSFLHGIRKGTSELQPRAECIEKIEQLLKKCRQNGGEPKQIAMCMNKTLNKEY